MRVLIIAGRQSQKITNLAKERFGETIELNYIQYLDDIEDFVNRGNEFERAIIFPRGYNRDEAISDVDKLKSDMTEFISFSDLHLTNNYELVIMTLDEQIALGFVEISLKMADRTAIVKGASTKVTKSDLYNLIPAPLARLKERYKVYGLSDLKEAVADSVADPLIDNTDPFGDDPTVGDISDSHAAGDWGESSWGSTDDEPKVDENDWNTGTDVENTSEEVENDPFSSSDIDSLQGISSDTWGSTSTNGFETEDTSGLQDDPFSNASGTDSDPFGGDIETENGFEESASDPFGASSETENTSNPFNETSDDPFGNNNNLSDNTEFTTSNKVDKIDDNPFGEYDTEANDFDTEVTTDKVEDSNDPFGDSSTEASKQTDDFGVNDPFKSAEFSSGNIEKMGDIDFDDFGEKETVKDSSENFDDPFGENEIAQEKAPDPFENDFDDMSEIKENEKNSNTSEQEDISMLFDGDPSEEKVINRTNNANISGVGSLFDEEENDEDASEMVADEPEEKPVQVQNKKGKQNNRNKQTRNNQNINVSGDKLARLKEKLSIFKRNGCIITVTGGVSSGKTTVAANMANLLCKMGYSVLVVDMDTSGRGQSSINFENYEIINSGDTDKSGVMQALSSTGDRTGRFVSIIREGYHLLGTSIRADKVRAEDCLTEKYINRFLHSCQNAYNFVIIDIPFEAVLSKFEDVITVANYVILTERLNNYGIMNMMTDMTNTENEDLTEELFGKSKVLFNMEDNCTSILGKKVQGTKQVLNMMDIRVSEILGYQLNYSFAEMNVLGVINYNNNIDKCWFTKKYYTDTTEGKNLFTELLCGVFEVK